MKIHGIIQARTGSERLPGKVLKTLKDKTVLQHLLKQVRASKCLETVVLATSNLEKDDKLAQHGKDIGLEVYRGNEDAIMHRLLYAAEQSGADIVVRLLGDCPLTDPGIIDHFVTVLLDQPELDMVTNQNPHSFPDGYDVSVIRTKSLKKACKSIAALRGPEHLSEFWNDDEKYNYKNILADRDYFSEYRVTLDYPEDLALIKQIVIDLDGENRVLKLQDVLDYLKQNNEAANLNRKYIE